MTKAVVAASLIVGGSVAVAAGSLRPRLLAPKGSVAAGKITLVVSDPTATNHFNPFVAIDPKRQVDRYGNLTTAKCRRSPLCDFVVLKRRKGHAGEWTYTTTINLQGYWNVTPGKYYWQEYHVAAGYPEDYDASRIGSFTVR